MEVVEGGRREAFFTFEEIGRLLRVPTASVRYWRHLGRIQAVRFGKRALVPWSALVRFLEERQVGLSAELDHMSLGGEKTRLTSGRDTSGSEKASNVGPDNLDNSSPSMAHKGAGGRKDGEHGQA